MDRIAADGRPVDGLRETDILALQRSAGNQAAMAAVQRASRDLTVQRGPTDTDFDDAVYGGAIVGMRNVPAGLKGRALKVYVVARWGRLSQEQAAALVDRTGVPSGGVDQRDDGSVVFSLTPAEEAMILRRRPQQGSDQATGPLAERGSQDRTTSGPRAESERSVGEQVAIGAADVGTDFAPIVSNIKDATIAATGVNPVTGEKVGVAGRVAAAIFAIPVLGNALKWLGKGGKALVKAGKWLAKRGGKWWRSLRKRLRSIVGAKKLKGAKAAQARAAFTIGEKQLQKKFSKHALAFGVTGSWNPANAAKFKAALERHVNDTANDVISGTYHNAKAIIHVNPTTGLAVVQDTGGAFVSGWRLNADQLRNVYAHGNLGGG